jgi:hypothetical protein
MPVLDTSILDTSILDTFILYFFIPYFFNTCSFHSGFFPSVFLSSWIITSHSKNAFPHIFQVEDIPEASPADESGPSLTSPDIETLVEQAVKEDKVT